MLFRASDGGVAFVELAEILRCVPNWMTGSAHTFKPEIATYAQFVYPETFDRGGARGVSWLFWETGICFNSTSDFFLCADACYADGSPAARMIERSLCRERSGAVAWTC